jgi:hypothetical protein
LDDAQTLRIEQGLRSVYEGACSPWQQEGQGYLQRCEDLPPRRITLDEGGNIQAISFTIHPDYPALVLER